MSINIILGVCLEFIIWAVVFVVVTNLIETAETTLGEIFGYVFIFFMLLVPLATLVAFEALSDSTVEEKTNVISSREIISLDVDKNVDGEGRFRLGTGSFVIESSDEYIFYYEDENGAIKRTGVPVESSEIYFDDKPRIEEVEIEKVTSQTWWIFYCNDREETPNHYRIYIPTGSVVSKFEI